MVLKYGKKDRWEILPEKSSKKCNFKKTELKTG